MFEELRDLYQDVILERSRHPRHAHGVENFDATAKGDNPLCGDRVQVWLRRDAAGAIADIGFAARGCAICMASADMMAEAVQGRDATSTRHLFDEFRAMARTGQSDSQDEAIEKLAPLSGVHEFPSRVKCATLPWHALMAALDGRVEGEHD